MILQRQIPIPRVSRKKSNVPEGGNRRYIEHACLMIAAVSMIGWLLARSIKLTGAARTNHYSGNVFYYLYTANEPLMFGLSFLLAILLLVHSRYGVTAITLTRHRTRALLGKNIVLITAAAVFFIALSGTFVIFHNFALCMDEYLSEFQADIFASGRLMAVIQEPWRQFAYAMTPIFATYNPEQHTWMSAYLPTYAAIRAIFSLVGLQFITNPTLAAVSILALAGVTKNLWPRKKSNTLVAVLMLATSSQFLITSMTAYSMPAHLCLNLIWLWLYIRDDKVGWIIVPWVGIIAMGLHQPMVHALFVLPFLVRIIRQGATWVRIYLGTVYLLGCGLWLAWIYYLRQGMISTLGVERTAASYFGFPGVFQLIIQMMNLSLLLSWQSLAMIILVVIAFRNWSSLTSFMKDLTWGCALTFIFYFFFKSDQGHGWGYRYCYAILGNLALLATEGWRQLSQRERVSKGSGLMLVSTCIALLVQIPVRAIQAESFVRPFADSMNYLRSIKEPFVVIDHDAVWYSQDLVRNDPLLRRGPKIFFSHRLTAEQSDRLKALGTVHRVQSMELSPFGLHVRE